MTHYTIGHIKPDLDAVVAAIALSVSDKTTNPSTPLIASPINNETSFIFEKFSSNLPQLIDDLDINENDTFSLVDHNEPEQRHSKISNEQINRIIDHHKLNVNFANPIEVIVRPLGSSTTVIYLEFFKGKIVPEKNLAQIMLAAVLSDTVGLKSSTTTDLDRQVVQDLKLISSIDNIDELTLEIFKAKSNISNLSPVEIVRNDYKVFDFSKKTFIGQLETVEQEEILENRKDELIAAMNQVKDDESVDLIFLAITDILKLNTKLILIGEEEQMIAEQAFNTKASNQIIDIGEKLSRKKDIAPAIETALQ